MKSPVPAYSSWAARSPRDPESARRPEAVVRLDGLRVLVVDDDDDSREIVGATLAMCGAKILLAGSARAALDAILRAPPDVLVSDVRMPAEDGYMLLREIRGLDASRGGRVPAIALTACAGPGDRSAALAAGFQEHLTKPVSGAELTAAVARVTRRGSPPNDPVAQ